MRKHKSDAQLAVYTEQALLDFNIKKHEQHKKVVNSGLVRIIVNRPNIVSIFVNDVLVCFSIIDSHTKYRIDDILDTVVAMKGTL